MFASVPSQSKIVKIKMGPFHAHVLMVFQEILKLVAQQPVKMLTNVFRTLVGQVLINSAKILMEVNFRVIKRYLKTLYIEDSHVFAQPGTLANRLKMAPRNVRT